MNRLDDLLQVLFTAHPWHGVPAGTEDFPKVVNAFIEIVPTDVVKYELDKASGLMRIDRPQRYSSLCPTLYGFVPQTYCGAEVAAPEQAFAGFDPARAADLREQRIFLGGERRGRFEHGDVGRARLGRRRLAIHCTTPRRVIGCVCGSRIPPERIHPCWYGGNGEFRPCDTGGCHLWR